jgi:uncharacterized membrane protein
MADQPQSFANHARRHPLFHFFLVPIFLINLILSIVWLARRPGYASAWIVVISLALLLLTLMSRMNPVKVQDRLIRLEERLRLMALLPEPLRSRIPELTEDQLIALRFASDAETPALVSRVLVEKLTRKDIKKAIEHWRPDYWRV